MRSILAIVAGLLLCSLSFAQGIPSAASGLYLTPDRVCRVVFQRYQVSWIRADLTCLEFSGALSNAASVLYAPGEGSCWTSGAAIPFNPQSPADYVAFTGSTESVVNTLVGNQAAVVNGGGSAQVWTRIAYAPSAAPFSCGDSPPAQAWRDERVCRLTGRLCGN